MWLGYKSGSAPFILLAVVCSFMIIGAMLYAAHRERTPGDKSERMPPRATVAILAVVALWIVCAPLCLWAGWSNLGPSGRQPVPISAASLRRLEMRATNMTALGYSLTPHQDHQDPVPPECRMGFTSPLITVPLVKNTHWPIVTARINNRLALDLMLDTGATLPSWRHATRFAPACGWP